jgi:outer membrane protein TolC
MRTKPSCLWGVIFILFVLSISGARAAERVKPLSLEESIDIALKQSVLIHAAKEGVRGAEAQQKEAFTGFLPKLSTSYSYTRYNRDPYMVFPGIPPLVPAGNLTVGTKDNYNWILEARQPLFAGGALLANYE